MKKFLGLRWIEFPCIITAVVVAEITTDYFQLSGFTSFVVWMIAWCIGYALCYFMIKKILAWKEKN